jgi:sugar lactone lactonase YvrE
MNHPSPFWPGARAAIAVAAVAVLAACSTPDPGPRGQASLEVHARLDGPGIGGITQMPDGRLVVGYHPFYGHSVQVALLDADKRTTTPYPSAEWQSCKTADGRWKSDFSRCLDWVLGLHTDANGILWMLDSAKTTDRAKGRPAALVPKLVGWDTHANRLARVIEIPEPASILESQHNDFVVDLVHQVIVIADEAIGEGSGGDGAKAALVVVDLKTGKSRRLLQGHESTRPLREPIRWDVGQPTEGSVGLHVGADGIALDHASEWLYYAPLNNHKIYRVRMSDLLDPSLTDAAIGARVQTWSDKPFAGGMTIDAKGNLYLTEVGERAVGIVPAETRRYRRYVQDPGMVWPDGVVYVSDGWMYTGAAQLPLVGPLQKDGVARNKPPYLIYRFRPEAPGRPGS